MKRLSERGVLLLVVGWLALASAAGGGRAEPKLEGIGVIWEKDPIHHTLRIGAFSYEVGSGSVLLGRHGERLDWTAIPVAREQEGRVLGMKQATAEFEARLRNGRLQLLRLKLIEPPR